MKSVFVSCQAIHRVLPQQLMASISGLGAVITHSPRNPLDGPDPRWTTWYAVGLPEAVAAASSFVMVIDHGWDSATWMAEEARVALLAFEAQQLDLYAFWNPQGISIGAPGMVPYLLRELPRDTAQAATSIIAAQRRAT